MYSQVLVSILILSPISIKSGTLISAPVSSIAGFVAFVAVFPANPGSVSVTSRSTKLGGSIANTFPLYDQTLHTIFSFTNLKLSESSFWLTGTCS